MKCLVLKQETFLVVTCLTIVLSCGESGGIRYSSAESDVEVDEALMSERNPSPENFIKKLDNSKGVGPIAAQVNFATAGSMIGETGERYLREIGESLAQYLRGRKLYVYGHTDSVGDPTSNLNLSLKRAQSITTLFSGFPIEAWGCGEEKPLATNNTPRGRGLNRRVEFSLGEYEPYSGVCKPDGQ
ncbi:MAG: hypothetical protein BWK78_01430 [Thiotrichaceae bacterium IS1]|nr:MAG: hypothetical protein BWK78_01430 [Thiotrichaceae bacterium IS1]